MTPEAASHRQGDRFRNPDGPAPHGWGDVWRWRRTRRPAPWPESVDNGVRPALPARVAPGEVALTFVNHSTFLAQFAGLALLTDPVWSSRVSPVRFAGPKRVHAPGVPMADLPAIDAVLVSHNHYDHLDLNTLRQLESAHAPVVISGLGNRRLLERAGLARVVELDWWQTIATERMRVTFVPAQHWSARSLFDRNRTLWGGFLVEADGRRVYFAGDTGYGSLFKAVAERLGPPDVAILPIGACEPRWFMAANHMNAADAVRAHADLGAPRAVAMHFGCFPLADESIDAPVAELTAARAAHGIAPEDFRVPIPGQTCRL
jgi:L-ascorbate metabolism protein UlaG (beta-lactamase superfamily)